MAESNQTADIVFAMEKLYLKDLSFEAPNTPQVFLEKAPPEVGLQLGIEHARFGNEDLYEVILAITVTATLQGKTVFLIDTKQAGLFRVRGVPPEEMPKVLEISCPSILLPFSRELINDLACKSGFPQLLINPVNFEALYMQKQAAPAAAH